MSQRKQLDKILSPSLTNSIDSDSVSYLKSYFEDSSNDFNVEAIREFVEPLLNEDGGKLPSLSNLCFLSDLSDGI